jgi:hypothetical protein
MSLVITSNTPKNDVNEPTQGINLPYSYTNHLQGTLKIPPQSQIAVQSVKFNKTGNIQLNKFNTQFGFYHGRDPQSTNWDLDEDFEDEKRRDDVCNNSLLVPTYILPKDEADKNFSYNTTQIAIELEKAWKKAIYHPNLLENASSGINPGPKVIALRNASEQGFSGWEFQLWNGSDVPKDALPEENISSLWINAYFGETPPSYSAPTIQNTDAVDYQAFIGTEFPLSLVNGSFNCSFGTHRSVAGKGFAYSEFAIGLTRACNTSADNKEDLPGWFIDRDNFGFSSTVNSIGVDFWDWCMASVYDAGESKHAVKVFHNVNGGNEHGINDGNTEMIEVDYNDGTYLYLENTESTNVVFNIQNERVKIFLEKSGGGTDYTLVNGADTGGAGGTTNASNTKPTCPSTRYLYPKMLMKPLKTFYIKSFNGVNVLNHTYSDDNYIDLWSQAKSIGNDLLGWCRFLDTNITAPVDKSTTNFKILNDQYGLTTAGDGDRIIGNFHIVSAPDTDVYVMGQTLNANKLLGFEGNTNTEPETLYSTAEPNILEWTSNQVPALTSTESMFVRLKNMTFDSANFSNSAMSKILYHIPTFDNSGNDVGALHLEPNEMVYLDLNNPNEVNLSTMEVDLVYNDETLATGVEGKTVVVFHIRPRI